MSDELRQLRAEVDALRAALDALESADVSGSFSLAAVTRSPTVSLPFTAAPATLH